MSKSKSQPPLSIAPLKKRYLAFLYDFSIVAILTMIISIGLQHQRAESTSEYSSKLQDALSYVIWISVYFSYFAFMDQATMGGSLAKQLFKIKVVNSSGKGLSMWQSMARSFYKTVLLFWPLFVYIFEIIMSIHIYEAILPLQVLILLIVNVLLINQTAHKSGIDLLCGTLVLKC